MIRGARPPVAVAALLAWLPALSGAVACSKDDATSKHVTRTLGERAVPVPPPPAATDDSTEAPEVNPHAAISRDAEPLYYTAKVRREAAAEKVDPDLAVLAAARVAGSSCFTGITDSSLSRSATIEVTVLPSGSVSRSEVSSGSTTEPWVLSCLETVGSGLHFTERADKEGVALRMYAINVTVTLTH